MKVFLAIHNHTISQAVSNAIVGRYPKAEIVTPYDHIPNSTEGEWDLLGDGLRKSWCRQVFSSAKRRRCVAIVMMTHLTMYAFLAMFADYFVGEDEDEGAFDPEIIELRDMVDPTHGLRPGAVADMLGDLGEVFGRHQILRSLPERHASQGSLRWVAHELATRWGSSTYSEAYNARKDPQRDAHHALLHITKAVGKVASELDALDHGSPASAEAVEKALADIVICATRVASVWPGGLKSIAVAVALRIAEKFPEKV